MGTKMAPAYANIFMGRLEGQLLKSVALRPFSWLRFIDDIDMVVARPRDFDSFPRRGQQLPPEHKVYGWNFNRAARVSGHQIKSCGRYNICWSVYKTNRYTPVSATRNTATKMFLTALHFASDVSAPIRTPFNQEQENLTDHLCKRVIRNRKFHLPLREHGNKREKTYFLISLNPSWTFSPSCWHITQTCQKCGI